MDDHTVAVDAAETPTALTFANVFNVAVPFIDRHLAEGRSAKVAIRSTGACLWFLPPYSPDLNPIEQAFAKIKHWMRNAQRRDFEDTWRHFGHLIATIEPAECKNYIRNVGYGSV